MIWQLSDIDEKRACKILAVSRFFGISNPTFDQFQSNFQSATDMDKY